MNLSDIRFKRFSTVKFTHIIIHHSEDEDTERDDWYGIDRYHTVDKGWSEIGYHFGSEMYNGKHTLCIGRSLAKAGGHTMGMNEVSIGICLVGNYDLKEPSPEQYLLIAELCRVLMVQFAIPIENIKRHSDYSEKTCPGRMFSMETLKSKIQEAPNA